MIISPKSSVFVDTSGWAESILRNTTNYVTMVAFYKRLIANKRNLATTNYVLTELVALLTTRSRLTRSNILDVIKDIKRSPRLQIIHIDEATDGEAWAMLERYTDNQWSLVYAASFVVMRRLGIAEAFTRDEHFAQAGFTRVPNNETRKSRRREVISTSSALSVAVPSFEAAVFGS